MDDCYCNLCDKTIKTKHEKKHINTKSHVDLSESIINNFCVKNPELFEIENKLQKHVNIYNKRFEFYRFICSWKLKFADTATCVKSKEIYSNCSCCGLIRYLIRKMEYFRRQGLRFSRKLEMNITFKTSLDLMTYKHYINQPMQMVERVPNRKFYKFCENVKRCRTHLTYGA